MNHEWWRRLAILDDDFKQVGSRIRSKVQRPAVSDIGHSKGVVDCMKHLVVFDAVLPCRLVDLRTAIA